MSAASIPERKGGWKSLLDSERARRRYHHIVAHGIEVELQARPILAAVAKKLPHPSNGAEPAPEYGAGLEA
jgi:hypothetical protein